MYSVIGMCHKSVVADRLAKDLYAEPDPETATAIVAALGDLGNRGAWKAFFYSGDERIKEKDETTRGVTEAMLWGFVHYKNQDLRDAAAKGLRLTQHTSTQARISPHSA